MGKLKTVGAYWVEGAGTNFQLCEKKRAWCLSWSLRQRLGNFQSRGDHQSIDRESGKRRAGHYVCTFKPVRWYMPVIPTCERQRQADLELKASLCHAVSTRLV